MKTNRPNRKILRDRNFPDSEQINKHQDFKQLHNRYAIMKKLLLKKIILWGSAMACAAGIAGVVLLNRHQQPIPSYTALNKSAAPKSCIQPPLPGKETPFTTYRISAKNGSVIHYATGSSISIPPNAFVNANGQSPSDSVDIKYREFHKPLDIFLSGIPMHYDSAGVAYMLESAGMLEILAFDHSENLGLAEGKTIDIRMASASNDTRFNLYELDTLKNNWMYKGKDRVEDLMPQRPERINRIAATRKPETTEEASPVKPEPSDPQKYSFKIAYDKTDFPELAAYDHVLFEVTDNSFKPAYFKINWRKITLDNSNEKGIYLVRLKKADTTISVTAKPVFEQADYQTALQAFEERHQAAGRERHQRELEQESALSNVNEALTRYNPKKITASANILAGIEAYRNFRVRRLGYHNCDWPLPILNYARSVTALSAKRQVNSRNYGAIFIVEKGKNTVFTFAKGQPVNFNPAAENLIWTLLNNRQLAFFKASDYKKLRSGIAANVAPVPAKSQELAFEKIRKFSE